jgi:dolichol-phosphate mannosyltransferase
MTNKYCDLSVVIPVFRRTPGLEKLLSQVRTILDSLPIQYEILIIDAQVSQDILKIVRQYQCLLVNTPHSGYGDKVIAGIQQASGNYIIVMEADNTHPATFLRELWAARENADVVIASRYVPGGNAQLPLVRKVSSRILNLIFSRGLDLNIRDMSSGFRIYKSDILKRLQPDCRDFDILQEILVKILMAGHQVDEIPFQYKSHDPAYERMTQFGTAYLRTFARLWKLRNSIASADYDARAYNAMMPPQRYWQRQRYKHITRLLKDKGKCLDVGCGSSRIIGALPRESIALDILIRKLRYARRFGQATVQGSIFNLPVPAGSFPTVLCSQVVEHVPRANVLDELDRVLQPGGFLILGTPDYGKWQWLVIEWLYKILLPQAYADEHITHYTFQELYDEFVIKRGYKLEATHYILQGELILGLRKPSAQ